MEITFLVNTEANARRIAFVESCFGSSGQVSWTFITGFQTGVEQK